MGGTWRRAIGWIPGFTVDEGPVLGRHGRRALAGGGPRLRGSAVATPDDLDVAAGRAALGAVLPAHQGGRVSRQVSRTGGACRSGDHGTAGVAHGAPFCPRRGHATTRIPQARPAAD